MNIIQKPSPNFAVGRQGFKPEIIVIHIMDGSLVGTDSWFANPASQVSSHYGIGFKGEVHQYVAEENVAWTQGLKVPPVNPPKFVFYKPGYNPNLYCLSIENEGSNLATAPEAQIAAIVELIHMMAAKWNIPIDRDHIIGHYEVDPIRKPNCPAVDKSILNTIVNRAKIVTGAPVVAPVGIKSKASILAKLDELRKEIENY